MTRQSILCLSLSSFIVLVTGCQQEPSESAAVPEGDSSSVAAVEDVETTAITVDPNQSGAAIFAAVCANCHGADGEGNREKMAPSIAGQPDWFVAHQLTKFQEGHRGAGELADPNGAMMRAIALAINEETIPTIAEAVQAMAAIPTTTTLQGDPEMGQEVFMSICAECHRFNGQGEKAFHSAPLTALPGWYIQESLRKFRTGERGYSHGDMEGPKMQRISSYLGEESIADIIAHIAVLAERYPPGERRRR